MKRTLLSKKRRSGFSGYPLFSWRDIKSLATEPYVCDLDCVYCYQPWIDEPLPYRGEIVHADGSVSDVKDLDFLEFALEHVQAKPELAITDLSQLSPFLFPRVRRQIQDAVFASASETHGLTDIGVVSLNADTPTITVEIYDQASGRYVKTEVPALTNVLPENLDLSNAVIVPRQHYKDGNLNGTRWYDPSNETVWVLNVLEPEKADGDHDHVFVRYPVTASDSVLVFNKAAAFEFMDKCQRVH